MVFTLHSFGIHEVKNKLQLIKNIQIQKVSHGIRIFSFSLKMIRSHSTGLQLPKAKAGGAGWWLADRLGQTIKATTDPTTYCLLLAQSLV